MTANIPTGDAGAKRPHSPLTLAVLALAGIALFLGFTALGMWQVQRRAWKHDLIERVTQRLHAASVPLPSPAEWPHINAASHEYLHVRTQGQWLPDKTVLAQATTELGAGFWVMTPLQTADGWQVLVNRGFIPQAQRTHWQHGEHSGQPGATTPRAETVAVDGLLRMSEPGGGFLRRNDPAQQRWHSRDVAAIAQAQGLAHAAPFFIDAGIPAAPSPLAGSEGPWPRPGLTVVRFHDSHLVYAITWFGLALLVVVAFVLVARYELRLRATSEPPVDEQR